MKKCRLKNCENKHRAKGLCTKHYNAKHWRYSDYGRTYQAWYMMIRRCTRADSATYHHYGGRGIKVCDRWLELNNFIEDMGYAPKGLSIDRINNDGDYEPSNCKWSTQQEQMNNRRSGVGNRRIEVNGEVHTLAEWVRLIPSVKKFTVRGWAFKGDDYFRKKVQSL